MGKTAFTTKSEGGRPGRRKLVLAVVAIVAALGAYLTGDADLVSALTQVVPVLVGQ